MSTKLTRRVMALASLSALLAGPALAQKSAAEIDWENKQAAYLAENLKKPGWKATESGVQYRRVGRERPRGAQPSADSPVTIKYEGKLVTGRVFDASPEGQPMKIRVNELVRGLREVLPMMRVGETWEAVVPAELGYGERSGPGRPPNSALVFSIELVEVGA